MSQTVELMWGSAPLTIDRAQAIVLARVVEALERVIPWEFGPLSVDLSYDEVEADLRYGRDRVVVIVAEA